MSILDQILNNQRPTTEKYGLGYKETVYEKGSSSKTVVNETNIHPETVRNNERKRDQEYEQLKENQFGIKDSKYQLHSEGYL